MARRVEPPPPLLTAIVVHWHAEDDLEALAREFPTDDPRFELLVIDNGSRRPLTLPPQVRNYPAGRNLGFAAGSNRGLTFSRSPLLLFLNPDARIDRSSLEEIVAAFEAHPRAAGVVPRMVDFDGRPLFGWQLRRVPSRLDLLRMAAWKEPRLGATREPAAGTVIEQPAAAAWALRTDVLIVLMGFDEEFHPAWFEDVDLALRLRERGLESIYWPAAIVRHGVGSSVGELGFGEFLKIHDRSMLRYAEKHHGARFARTLRRALVFGTRLRLAALPLRIPKRARDRADAKAGLRERLRALRHPD